MKNIIKWLQNIEQLAFDLYSEASVIFKDDKELSDFLSRLAEDEALHFHLMSSASNVVKINHWEIKAAIVLTEETKNRIEFPLRKSYELLKAGKLTPKDMIKSIADSEYSAWNDLFLYLINILQNKNKTFQFAASIMQSHRSQIEKYLDSLPDDLKPDMSAARVPTIWENRILVAEDEDALRDLLAEILEMVGVVDTAEDGMEALQLLKENYYNVIVADIIMPEMDGLQLYKEAVKEDSKNKNRFIFCSGFIDSETQKYMENNNIKYLRKPFDISKVIELVKEVVEENAGGR